ncbi:MAG: isoprenylcysteine carboxylmethyltransferase family protein [Nitrospiraceae bacterium]|nr:MAG: isoprenylcysteine carboxylmethyltransferase family protein [Nitrospiraceae bacterium]
MNRKKTILSSAIVLYFIIGLEILIMISPFAGFFYSVFNPFLLEIAKYPATRWLSAFFLPHMVVPPDAFLKFVRVMGSALFVGGMALFFICAAQIYLSKFLKRGAVIGGIYSFIRHPQYLSLAIAGAGLSILWPRFLVVVLWLAMVLIYYFLSRDEERRMLRSHAVDYGLYMERTGMFLPKPVEKVIMPQGAGGRTALFILISVLALGSAFFLRYYTISHLPIWSDNNVVAMSITDDDKFKMEHRMADILRMDEIKPRLNDDDKYLVYFLPPHYIMQGLIADTGGDWKLYKQHHTMSMITDWVLHPFSHLSEAHQGMHAGMQHDAHSAGVSMTKRLIFLKIGNAESGSSGDMFSINARRIPQFMIDIGIHDLRVIDLKELPVETGWGTVPTPVF